MIPPTNWNLVVLQLLDLIGNHSHGFCIGINFGGIECLIHRYSCYASLNYIFRTNTSFYIHRQSFIQSLFIRYKRDAFHLTVLCIQFLKYGIDNTLLVHHPTKNNILVCRTFQKIIEQVTLLFVTIAFVSSVTWNGFASQHQSPSRNTLFGKSCLSCWHTVVFPTPIVPPIIYKVFIIHTYKFLFS